MNQYGRRTIAKAMNFTEVALNFVSSSTGIFLDWLPHFYAILSCSYFGTIIYINSFQRIIEKTLNNQSNSIHHTFWRQPWREWNINKTPTLLTFQVAHENTQLELQISFVRKVVDTERNVLMEGQIEWTDQLLDEVLKTSFQACVDHVFQKIY